jgi:transcriptional regulator with PAS, ATPase and Fis domain
MHWPSFLFGLLALPVLISGLLLARIIIELALTRRTSMRIPSAGARDRQEPVQIEREEATPPTLNAVLDSLPVPTILIGQDLAIEAANQQFRSLYAGDREICGRPCHEVSHGSARPCDLHGEECPLLGARRSGRTRRALHVHRAPGGLRHVEVTVRPVMDSAGNAISFLESLRPSTIASTEPHGKRLVGRAPAFNRMLARVERVAPTDFTVLLAGEPGSGREAVARSVHQLSRRSRRPFLPVDCSGARGPWFEMELFGTAAGEAGEPRQSPGLLEAARGGTVYLNEVGELPKAAQARLLRALETGAFRRAGGWQARQTSFRLVCSTSSELQRLADEGRFMPELLLRVGGLSIRVPSLRERPGDLELLIKTELGRLEGCQSCRLGDKTLALLRSYSYPGNLRELAALLQYASVFATDGVILPEHLPERIGACRQPTRPGVASPPPQS